MRLATIAVFLSVFSCLPRVGTAQTAQRQLPVFVILREQPQRQILERIEAGASLRMGILQGEYQRRAKQAYASDESLRQAQERVDAETIEVRTFAASEIREAIRPGQDEVEAWLLRLGATAIERYWIVNMLTAEIPPSTLDLLKNHPAIAEVFPVGKYSSQLKTSAPTLGAPAFWDSGYTGAGQSIAIFDTGVRTDHPAFRGKSIISQVMLTFGSRNACFNDDISTARDFVGHGTQIAGIIASQGSPGWSSYQGIAKGIGTLYNVKVAYRPMSDDCDSDDDTRDILAGFQWAAANTPAKIFSFSRGEPAGADDDGFARVLDQVADNFQINITVAAGNSGPDGKTVITPATAYNLITVGHIDHKGTPDRSDDEMNPQSSRGPTAGGRYKPDMAAPGTNIVSTAQDLTFTAGTGSSFAAPQIAGALALMRQAGVTDPLALKAILLNSTDTPGWQPDQGWGFANLWLARNQLNSFSASVPPSESRLYKGSIAGPFRATLTWNRHVSGANSIFNDLDLELYDRGGNSAISSSMSEVQNVEQVSATGSFNSVLKVSAGSSVFGGGISAEPFAVGLSQSGFVPVNGPNLAIACTGPAVVNPASSLTISCAANNAGDLEAFSVSGTLDYAGGLAADFGTIPAAGTVSRSWSVGAPAAQGDYSLRVAIASSSFGESYSATTNFAFRVGQVARRRPHSVGTVRKGFWILDNNGNAQWDGPLIDRAFPWGQPGDAAVAGDWSGSGTSKAGVVRPDATWVLDRNGAGRFDSSTLIFSWGQRGDIPIAGDWNGSGTSKAGVFRAGQWILDYNGNGVWDGPQVDRIFLFGQAGDVPVAGDWNGSGTTKAGVFRKGQWVLDYNGNGVWDGPQIDRTFVWGQANDIPIAGDWSGSGQAKAGAFRAGQWILDFNGNGVWDGPDVDRIFAWGQAGDAPIVGQW